MLKYWHYSWFLVAYCCFYHPSFGQSASILVPEQLHVHLDKPFYATGETIWYKIYFLNQDTSAIRSSILYIDLISPTGELLAHQKLLRKQFYAYGDIHIPLVWKEGYYFLRCYTLWNLNFGEEAVFSQFVPIYNMWNETNTSNDKDAPVQTYGKVNPPELKINVQTNHPVYCKGDSVILTIMVTDTRNKPVKANLSLAVLDTDLVPLRENAETSETRPVPIPTITMDSLKFAPEKQLDLQAVILSVNTSEPVSSQFISIYSAENHEFISKSITQGELSVSFPDFFGAKTFQIHNHNPFQEAIPFVKIYNIIDLLPPPALTEQMPTRDAVIERYLHFSKLRHKLGEIFYTPPSNNHLNGDPIVSPFIPDKTYRTENFQLIKNVEEFIDHVFTKVRVTSENGKKTVKLFDPVEQRFLEDSPWYMVNGYLTRQEEKVLKIPLNSIERLDVFLDRNTIIQQFSPMMLRNGVIAIYTKDRKIPTELITERNTFIWNGFHLPQPFTADDIPDQSTDKIPDFRPLVFWEPCIETDRYGKATIMFPTSDAISTFSIRVEGVSVPGKLGIGYSSYQTQFPN